MSEFFEYDPVTGIRTDWEYDNNTGDVRLTRTADVEPLLDFAKASAAEVGKNTRGIREGWHLYATLPAIVQVQMRAKGIDITRVQDQPRMLAEINENYRDLRCTTGWEGKRATPKIFIK